jgi:hypothetical protein
MDMSDNATLKTPLAERKELFWDISPERVATVLRENNGWAIVRIFEYGNIADIFDAIEFYGPQKTARVLSQEDLRPTARVMACLFSMLTPSTDICDQP